MLAPTALFFPKACYLEAAEADPDPPRGQDDPVLTREDCARMGRALSAWYFGEGGLLMSEDARDAYFELMTSLGGAVDANAELAAQTVKQHGSLISPEQIKEYRKELGIKPGRSEPPGKWVFGIVPGNESPAGCFKDFILVQMLASQFRNKLTSDLESREPPKGEDV